MSKQINSVGLNSSSKIVLDQIAFAIDASNGVNFVIRARDSYKAFKVLISEGLIADAICCLAQSYEFYLKFILHGSDFPKPKLKKIRHDTIYLFTHACGHYPKLLKIKNDDEAYHLLEILARNYVKFRYLENTVMFRGIRKDDEDRHSKALAEAMKSKPIDISIIHNSMYNDLFENAHRTINVFEDVIQNSKFK